MRLLLAYLVVGVILGLICGPLAVRRMRTVKAMEDEAEEGAP